VRTAFQKEYPKATTQGCAKEVENDKAAYEISSTEGKTKRDVLYYGDGTLIVVEEAIDAAELPKGVQQAIAEVLEDHKIELVEKLRRDDIVTYEIKSKHADVALEIVFDGWQTSEDRSSRLESARRKRRRKAIARRGKGGRGSGRELRRVGRGSGPLISAPQLMKRTEILFESRTWHLVTTSIAFMHPHSRLPRLSISVRGCLHSKQ
jgi:hypothetical protein